MEVVVVGLQSVVAKKKLKLKKLSETKNKTAAK